MTSFTFCTLIVLFFGGATGNESVDVPCPDKPDINAPQNVLIDYLTNPCRYNNQKIPNDNPPLNVTTKMEITHLDAKQTEVTAHILVYLRYTEPNFNFANITPHRLLILGDESLASKIWTPNVKIRDEDGSTVLKSEKQDIFIAIEQSGRVTYTYREMVTFYCCMDLSKFPFDYQHCKLGFSDWTYSGANLQLVWGQSNALNVSAKINFSDYILDVIVPSAGTTLGPYQMQATHRPTGRVAPFSQLIINIQFHRNIGFYMLDFFVPSFVLLATAWVSFWLRADASPPRAILGASTTVAFITLHLGVINDVPKVSYVKASDIWFFAVILFIFSSLVEFAFANVVWRRKKEIELKEMKPHYILKSALMPKRSREDLRKLEAMSVIELPENAKNIDKNPAKFYIPDEKDVKWVKMTPQEVSIYIDCKARILFPAAFAIFNAFYWTFVFLF